MKRYGYRPQQQAPRVRVCVQCRTYAAEHGSDYCKRCGETHEFLERVAEARAAWFAERGLVDPEAMDES